MQNPWAHVLGDEAGWEKTGFKWNYSKSVQDHSDLRRVKLIKPGHWNLETFLQELVVQWNCLASLKPLKDFKRNCLKKKALKTKEPALFTFSSEFYSWCFMWSTRSRLSLLSSLPFLSCSNGHHCQMALIEIFCRESQKILTSLLFCPRQQAWRAAAPGWGFQKPRLGLSVGIGLWLWCLWGGLSNSFQESYSPRSGRWKEQSCWSERRNQKCLRCFELL